MQIEYTRESIKQIKNLDKFMKQRVKHAIEKLPEGQIIVKAVLPRGKVYKRM